MLFGEKMVLAAETSYMMLLYELTWILAAEVFLESIFIWRQRKRKMGAEAGTSTRAVID